jgi:hypothetical protein
MPTDLSSLLVQGNTLSIRYLQDDLLCIQDAESGAALIQVRASEGLDALLAVELLLHRTEDDESYRLLMMIAAPLFADQELDGFAAIHHRCCMHATSNPIFGSHS